MQAVTLRGEKWAQLVGLAHEADAPGEAEPLGRPQDGDDPAPEIRADVATGPRVPPNRRPRDPGDAWGLARQALPSLLQVLVA